MATHKTIVTVLACILLHDSPALAQEGSAEAVQQTSATESATAQGLDAPQSVSEALESTKGLEKAVEGADVAELRPPLAAWLLFSEQQSAALEEARSAPQGSPQRAEADVLRADLDRLLAGADLLAGAIVQAGGDVEEERARLERLRPDEQEVLSATTVPESRQLALELPIEVLKAQLRPLTREQVESQLAEWLEYLQRAALEVRNIEISALKAEDPAKVQEYTARGVELRSERSALIQRVEAVIEALERKGGEVADARAYVDSVTAQPTVVGLHAAWAMIVAWMTDVDGGLALLKSTVLAVGILIAFWFLSKVLRNVAIRATGRLPHASGLLREFITTMVQRITVLIGVLIALSTLGVNMTPLVAAIGAAGLVVGLALQGTLSNLASGLLIMVYRPFDVDDVVEVAGVSGLVVGLALQGTLSNLASGLLIMVYRPFDVDDVVEVAGVSGKVVGMTLMTTSVRTFDNQSIHVPNNKIWGDVITNLTEHATRRVDLVFGISYGDDIEKAKEILSRVVQGHPSVLADPAPMIRVGQLGDSSVDLLCRPWVRTEDYWEVFWGLTEDVKKAFDAEGISIPFPQRDVHLIPVESTEGAAGGEAE